MEEMVVVVRRGNKYVTAKEAELQATTRCNGVTPLQISSLDVAAVRKTISTIRTSCVT